MKIKTMKSVIIYDPSSNICKRFIEQTNVICLPINKKKIYDRIKASPYQIRSVPCILTFSQGGKIEKYESVDAIRFMEALNNMEDEKEQQENNPEIALAGNERFMVPEPRPDDNRPDPEAARKPQPLQDSSGEGGSNSGMLFTTNRELVDRMRKDIGK